MAPPILKIDSKTQSARLETDGRVIRTFPVSTGTAGMGNAVGSLKTPTGLHRVAEKFGEGAPVGAVFRRRLATGEVWSTDPTNPLAHSAEDLVLTRVLWLAGLEPENAGTFDRYIYLHGTNQETDLGKPASHGCVRFSNADIIEVFTRLPVGAFVEIE